MQNLDMLPFEAERNPVVFAREGEVFANSRDVAAFFGKHHRHVLDAVDNLISQEPDLGLRNFRQTPYIEPQNGQTYRSFDMDREGFELLAMGFTGTKALKWKRSYIRAFKTMEDELRARPVDPMSVLGDPAQLRGLLLSYSERVEKLETVNVQLETANREIGGALDRISNREGSLCVRDTAKTIQVSEKALWAYLRNNGWVYRRPGAGHDLAYQPKLIAGLLVHKETAIHRADGTEKIATQVRVTAKGMTALARILSPQLQLVGGTAA
jgi:Rha family phage regulatory protein